MAHTTSGLYALFSLPRFYSLYQSLVGGLAGRERVIREIVRPKPGDRILDIGCGPGDVVGFLPEGVEYVGFDQSETYIQAARKRFGHRATFHCERIAEKTLAEQGCFDMVLTFGVLQSLDDPEAEQLFHLASQALKPGGRLIVLDNCYVPDQSRVARWLISMERGRNVRDQEAYLRLARTAFSDVTATIYHDLFRVPYTIVILECRR